MILPKPSHSHRPLVNTPPRPKLLAPPTYNPGQPKSHSTRTSKSTADIHLLIGLAPTLSHPGLWGNRDFYVLRHVRSHPHPYPRTYYPLREPSRTTQCGNLLLVLHTCRLPPPTRRTSPPPERDRHPVTPHPSIQQAPPPLNMKQQSLMSRLSYRLPSKNTTIRRPLVTPQSTRRSPNRRLHGPSRCPTKTRRLRHNTHDTPARPTVKRTGLPLYRLSPMRSYYNWLNLPTPNRPQILNCLLLS